ncbi:hypothetical protein [Brevibacterium oceani]|uniref:hypothetical protein n=1 Tax=Brevibacterium oceani TaxID=358099 RepID=UPI0015E717D7|nr:hypothetical protein [Brevibacterium oceani]
MTDLTAHMRAITDELERTTEVDTLDRAQMRVRLVFDMFYDARDPEPGEPDQAIRDCLTDLMRLAAERGVDFEDAVRRATGMWSEEREDWGLDDV